MKLSVKFFVKLLSTILVILTLTSCGLKGPLYYSTDKDNQTTQSNTTA